jgi:hypothetical protein
MRKTIRNTNQNRRTRKLSGGTLMIFDEKSGHEQVKQIDMGDIGDFRVSISSHAFKHIDTFDEFTKSNLPDLPRKGDRENMDIATLEKYYEYFYVNGHGNKGKPLDSTELTAYVNFVKEILKDAIKINNIQKNMFKSNSGTGYKIETWNTNPTVKSMNGTRKPVNLLLFSCGDISILFESINPLQTPGYLQEKDGKAILRIRSIFATNKGKSLYNKPGHPSAVEIYPLDVDKYDEIKQKEEALEMAKAEEEERERKRISIERRKQESFEKKKPQAKKIFSWLKSKKSRKKWFRTVKLVQERAYNQSLRRQQEEEDTKALDAAISEGEARLAQQKKSRQDSKKNSQAPNKALLEQGLKGSKGTRKNTSSHK